MCCSILGEIVYFGAANKVLAEPAREISTKNRHKKIFTSSTITRLYYMLSNRHYVIARIERFNVSNAVRLRVIQALWRTKSKDERDVHYIAAEVIEI